MENGKTTKLKKNPKILKLQKYTKMENPQKTLKP
jgi:hypothetical protein